LNNSLGRGVIDVDFFGYKQGLRHPAGFNDPVGIALSPQPQTVLDGTPVTFPVDVTGTPPYFFQWFANNAPIAGATNQSYSLLATVNDNGKVFFVTVSNLFSAATSSNALLTVAPLFIVTQPMSTNVGTGGNVTFTAAAIGAPPLFYQWRWNGVNLLGATNSSYTVFNVHSTNAGVYSVVIRNAAGAVLSDDAELFVFGISGPSQDNFVDRLEIFGTNSEIRGVTTGKTNEVGEPNHAGYPARHSIWYKWQMPSSGIATFDTRGSTFDSLLAVYTGPSVSNLLEVASDDDRGGNLNALVRFNVIGNTFYHIAVDGFAGASGNSLLNWNFESTSDVLPVITSQPLDRTVLAGTNVNFSVAATGAGLKYLWLLNGGPLLGATGAVLVVSNVQPPKVGGYTVRITNNVFRGVESRAAALEIGPVPTVRSRDKVEDIGRSGGGTNLIAGPKSAETVTATASATPPLPVSMGTINSQVFNNTDATTSQHETPPCGQIGGSSKWFGLLTDQDGYFVADTYSVNTTIDTVMAVYKSTNLLSPLAYVTCDDNSAPDHVRSRVVFAAERNVDYLVAVDGVDGARGGIQLNVALGRLPVLATTPFNQLVSRGGHFTFSVAWSNAVPEPGVLWLHDGAPLPAATNAGLTLSNVQFADAGNYRVVLTNQFGAVSNAAGILVTVADLIPQSVGGQSQLRVSGTTGPGFVMQVSTDLTTWTPAYIHTSAGSAFEYVTNIASRPRGFYRAAP
ncbi:MAG TPA: immunoglobulin domain-containing protein, partial [Verrucomicrobiae bacterium]